MFSEFDLLVVFFSFFYNIGSSPAQETDRKLSRWTSGSTPEEISQHS
jgi:hypothetical protein